MKTSELKDGTLDWAVECLEDKRSPESTAGEEDYSPSTNWSQGGPIIEREKIQLEWDALFKCWTSRDMSNGSVSFCGETFCGDTPLIAAMRCYVASKLGDEVEIPEGLK